MSFEEEAALLEPFRKKGKAGQIVEVSEIKAAYQKAVGHSLEQHRFTMFFAVIGGEK